MTNKGTPKMEGQTGNDLSPMEGRLLPNGAWTFDMVQDRLVEAMVTCWRGGDRERAWLHVRSAWPEIQRDRNAGDYDARGGEASSSEVALRSASLTRVEVAEMEEAFAWVGRLSVVDRKVLAVAIGQLASGKREVDWGRVLRKLDQATGRDGLRMRYARAIASICEVLNGGNPRALRVNRDDVAAV
ncbi:hypothetical protein [Sphingomonas zeae]|uniref:hypothetical protein n=2 Tax=Sphingomonas TaxID=13687 RepID=UPI0025509E3D|nr:hypothetical protein [Sphingomonas zeae]MDK8186710.1 hypothetical protein [Sphingomonas zeae]